MSYPGGTRGPVRRVARGLIQLLALAAIVVIYLLLVTRGRLLDWGS